MGKLLNAPQGVYAAVGRLEDHPGAQLLHQARLPGNAELGGKVRADMGNGLHGAPPFRVRPAAGAPCFSFHILT